MTGASEARRRILYGRRQGRRLRPGRQALVDGMLPRLAVPAPEPGVRLDPFALFDPPPREVWLEIGFGGGEHLAWQAAAHPEVGFIGCEPFVNGVASLLASVERERLANVRVLADDARLLLDALPDASIGRAFVLFPDPWPKRRHWERRILGPETLPHLARVLADGAELRLATDDADYLGWMLSWLARSPDFAWTARRPSDWRERPADWPATRYEAKALAAGRRPAFLSYRRRPRTRIPLAAEGPSPIFQP